MAQNAYDNQAFFDAYAQFERQIKGPAGAAEWPTVQRMVGSVAQQSVLDLGCGYGWFARWAVEAGAARVLGLDVSEKMLARAATFPADERIAYERRDLEGLSLPAASFDLAYSCLAFHYVPDLHQLFGEIARALKPGGRLVFVVEHPVTSGRKGGGPQWDEAGEVFFPVAGYFDEGLRATDWLGTGPVHKYHHTVETYVGALLQCGLRLTAFRESWDGIERKPDPKRKSHSHWPYFLMIAAELPGAP